MDFRVFPVFSLLLIQIFNSPIYLVQSREFDRKICQEYYLDYYYYYILDISGMLTKDVIKTSSNVLQIFINIIE